MEEYDVSKFSSAELSAFTNGILSAQFLRWNVDDGHANDDETLEKFDLSYIDEMLSAPPPVLQISSADKVLIREANLRECKKSPTMSSILALTTIPSPQGADERGCFHLDDFKLDPSQLNDRDQMNFFKSISSVGLDKEGALEHQIHTIFKWENWQTPLSIDFGTSRARDAWVAMTPAFILASKMLTSSATERYWHQLMCGVPVKDRMSSRFVTSCLEPTHLQQDPAFIRASFKKLLRILEDRVTFSWQPGFYEHGQCHIRIGGLLEEMDEDLYREIAQRSNVEYLDTPACKGRNMALCIAINPEYLHSLLSPHLANAHPNFSARLHLQLAVTLCHELAHAIWMLRYNAEDELCVFETDFRAEVGFSFENWLWRGAMVDTNAIMGVPDQNGKIHVQWWDCLIEDKFRVELDSSFAEALFREEPWSDWDAFMAAMPRPSGQPSGFVALRYIRSGQLAGSFCHVTYKDGVAMGEHHACLNLERGPAGRDVESWYRELRARDIEDACATGVWEQTLSINDDANRYLAIARA